MECICYAMMNHPMVLVWCTSDMDHEGALTVLVNLGPVSTLSRPVI